MNIIDKIQEILENEYTDVDREEMYDDIESLFILFSAKNRAIEERIKIMEDRIKFINASDSVFKGSMSASKELHRLRGIKKELKRLMKKNIDYEKRT